MIKELTRLFNSELDKLTELKANEKKYDTEIETAAYLEGYIAGFKHENIIWNTTKIGDRVKPRQGMSTNDNQRFLRRWFEVSFYRVGLGMRSMDDAETSGKKWFPYNKGGEYRKWQGNNDYLVNWENNGAEIKDWLVNNPQDPKTTHWSRRIINTDYYFKEVGFYE